MKAFFETSLFQFPPEWVKAALVLAMMSVWVVIALFTYLNRFTRKRYFSLWTVAWMFYSVFLAASIGLEETPDTSFLMMARRACIGISALFLFWGTLDLTGRQRRNRELGLGVILIVAWSYVAAYQVRSGYWITLPVFLLLAAAGVQTGMMCLRYRQPGTDTQILGFGFVLWGLHLLAFPFVHLSPALLAGAYLASAVLCSLITVGMVIQQQKTRSQEDYQMLFDSASDAMFLVDYETWKILEANRAARRVSDGLVGRSLQEVFPELKGTAGGMMAGGEGGGHRELRRPRIDGQDVVYEVSANLMLQPRGPVLLLVARDITERKQNEQTLRITNQQLEKAMKEARNAQGQVVQQERLRALGEMASGVAHDFNNSLAKILGFNELLLNTPSHLNDPVKVTKYLHMVSAAAQEAVSIVNRLREFYRSRKETEAYEPVRLDQIVEQAILLTQPKWKDQMLARGAPVRIALDLQPVPVVAGSAADLREVVINLTFNAIEAMSLGGGTLTYRTIHQGETVLLQVRDTGGGMTEEIRQRCLEPFFTTKGDASTGLGLAIVYGIIKRHGGSIDIETVLGEGTTMLVRLPIQALAKPMGSSGNGGMVRPLRILVVDDEPMILEIEREYLSSEGHHVETSVNGREGLDKFLDGSFDLVLLDRAMPEINGEQVATRIKQHSPETPVILVTGFSEMLRSNGSDISAVDMVVSKPFTQAILRQAVVKVMAEQRGQGRFQS